MAGTTAGSQAAKKAFSKSQKRAFKGQEKTTRKQKGRVISRKVIRKASSIKPRTFEVNETGSTTSYNPVANSSQTGTSNAIKYGCLGASASLILPKMLKYISDKITERFK